MLRPSFPGPQALLELGVPNLSDMASSFHLLLNVVSCNKGQATRKAWRGGCQNSSQATSAMGQGGHEGAHELSAQLASGEYMSKPNGCKSSPRVQNVAFWPQGISTKCQGEGRACCLSVLMGAKV